MDGQTSKIDKQGRWRKTDRQMKDPRTHDDGSTCPIQDAVRAVPGPSTLVTLPNLIQPPSSRGYSTGDETGALCDSIKVALVPIPRRRLTSFHAFLSRRATSGSYNDCCLSMVPGLRSPRTEEG